MDLCNPSVIKSLLGDEGTHLRKEYGQNFLIRREIPERIAEECTENEDSMILEIGPGQNTVSLHHHIFSLHLP